MDIINRKFLFIIIVMGVLSGCNSRMVTKEDSFLKLYEDVDMNASILLDEPIGDSNSRKIGDLYRLMLVNTLPTTIVFPNDHGIHIYSFHEIDKKWVEVENSLVYIPPGNRFLSPKDADPPGITVISFEPVIPNAQSPMDIRVSVQGWLENDPEHLVGAYIDITLNP